MYEFFNEVGWQGVFVVILLIITLFLLIKELLPIEVTLFSAGVIPVIVGITPTYRFFNSIANETIVTIAMLFIVVKAFEMSGIVYLLVKKILPSSNHKLPIYLIGFPSISFFSAFLNNTPIVMMIVPIIRRWCLEQKLNPSKFLMPVSFVAILGGMCTLIGTSTNLVVNGLLIEHLQFSLNFFEIAKIGVICAVLGLLFIILFSRFLIPSRIDPSYNLSQEMKKAIVEFIVEKSDLVGKSIHEIDEICFKGECSVLEVIRDHEVIEAPLAKLILKENDRLIILGDINQIAKLHLVKGLKSVADPKFEFARIAAHYYEYTVPANSNLVGTTLKNIKFRTKYGGSVFTIYRQERYIYGKIGDKMLQAGDVLLVLSSKHHKERKTTNSKDIFSLSPSVEIPIFSLKNTIIISLIMIGMVLLATFFTSMMIASIIAVIMTLVFKQIPPKMVIKSINWDLLIMIIGGLALSSALGESKVANYFGKIFLPFTGKNPHILIAVIFICTTLLTELITNTAAVLIVFPIFLQALIMLGFTAKTSFIAMAITIAVAGSCSFLTPIGYQTNTIVYGLGGYHYSDFFKLGLPLTLIILAICTFLIPIIWPLA
jgi:di/tricarboxylate transporter